MSVNPKLLQSAVALAAAASIAAGCGSSKSSPGNAGVGAGVGQTGTSTTSSSAGGKGGTPPAAPIGAAPAPGQQPHPAERRFRAQVMASCAANHRIRHPGKGGARSAQAYAQNALPLALATLKSLQHMRPPAADRPAITALIGTYQQAIGLYQQVGSAAPASPEAKQAAAMMGATNRRLQQQAIAAGVPSCGPPVV